MNRATQIPPDRHSSDSAIQPRLSVLQECLKREANLHLLGRFLARMHLRDLLETNRRLARAWREPLSPAPGPVRHPVFITGMPRSGSTYLHELLGHGPLCRAPLVWEVMFPPSSASGNGSSSRRRIRKAAFTLWWFRRFSPAIDSVHPLRATMPQECVAIHSHTMLSREFATIFRVPRYEQFLDATDFAPAYAWEKRFLQHLQNGEALTQWFLKAPDHAFSLDALFAVFPDAVIVQTHRNPLDVLKSSAQLTEVLRRTFARPEPRDRIGAREVRLLDESINRINLFRDSRPDLADRFIDVKYEELVSDPLCVVSRVLQRVGLDLGAAASGRIKALASRRTRYPGRASHNTLADFGIDRAETAERFAGYCDRFDIVKAPLESAGRG